MPKILSLEYATSLTDICKLNSSFDKATLRVCYPGENRNHSYISKDALVKCIPTLFNCPLVTHYDRETDSLGGHDMEVFKDNDGNLRLVNLTQPVGTIPESSNVWFEEFEEENGETHEYLCVEAILWKRQESYQKIKRDGITKHSMEIEVKDGEMKDGCYHIYDFEFNAFCLISVEPCFEGSALEFTMRDFKEQFAEMMQEFKESYQNYSMEGGEQLEQNQEKLVEQEPVIETAGTDTEPTPTEEPKDEATFTEEEPVTEKPVDEGDDSSVDETPAEGEPTEEPTGEEQDFNLTSNIVDELIRVLSEPQVDKGWGEVSNYWYVDSNLEASQVYCYDVTDWLLYGFTYSTEGDAVTIDWSSKARKKFDIVDFEGSTEPDGTTALFSAMEQKITDGKVFEQKYSDASTQLSSMQDELKALREFKQGVQDEKVRAERQTVLEEFEEKLSGITEFAELKEHAQEYEVPALKEKCFAICGKNGIVMKFSAGVTKAPSIKVGASINEEVKKPYGGVVEKYLGTNH